MLLDELDKMVDEETEKKDKTIEKEIEQRALEFNVLAEENATKIK